MRIKRLGSSSHNVWCLKKITVCVKLYELFQFTFYNRIYVLYMRFLQQVTTIKCLA